MKDMLRDGQLWLLTLMWLATVFALGGAIYLLTSCHVPIPRVADELDRCNLKLRQCHANTERCITDCVAIEACEQQCLLDGCACVIDAAECWTRGIRAAEEALSK